jgi:hypothetical protein
MESVPETKVPVITVPLPLIIKWWSIGMMISPLKSLSISKSFIILSNPYLSSSKPVFFFAETG